jgi:flagellar biosynthesis protein FlhF
MSLRLKSYYAASVETAFAAARRELGDEAMLVHSRRAAPAHQYLGEYEVVFALPDGSSVPAAESGGAGAQRSSPSDQDRFADEVTGLRRELERVKDLLVRPGAFLPSDVLSDPDVCQLLSALQNQDVSSHVIRQIAAALRAWFENGGKRGDRGDLRRAAARQLEAMVRVAPSVGLAPQAERSSGGGRRVAAFVGPPGSGKTSALVKLAATEAVRCRRPALIISADTQRIAGSEQLRCLAAILGVGFQTVEASALLAQSLEEHRHKELILIDTPGFSPGDMDYAHDLSAVISRNSEIDTHLVLSATLKSADLTTAVERFAVFRPSKLLFTRLDETGTYGTILNEVVRTGLPLSYLCRGQSIPEDIEPARPQRLVELLLPQSTAHAGSR